MRGRGESKRLVVVGAITANVVIAIGKFVAAAFTGSSAMFSEGVHSLIDTGDGLLLMFGEHRSKRSPDALHPFGYGRELYFWTLVVAMLIFGVGGGLSIVEGIKQLMHPRPVDNVVWNYAVLGLAFLSEGASFLIAVREFRRHQRRGRSVAATIRTTKDPTVFTVVFEDGAALIGVFIALASVIVGQVTGSLYADGIASILIGLLLTCVALVLARESKDLLIGESADTDDVHGINDILKNDPAIALVHNVRAMQLGAQDIAAVLDVRFRDGHDIERATARISDAIRARHRNVHYVYVSPIRATSESDDGDHDDRQHRHHHGGEPTGDAQAFADNELAHD
jgi:cation diffusion facilitator family transporter